MSHRHEVSAAITTPAELLTPAQAVEELGVDPDQPAVSGRHALVIGDPEASACAVLGTPAELGAWLASVQRLIPQDPPGRVCAHLPWPGTAHCAEMGCGGYVSRCPVHALARTGDTCNLPAVPRDVLAAGVTSLETARLPLTALCWLLSQAPPGSLTRADAYSIQTRIDDLRDLLTAAEASLPAGPSPMTAARTRLVTGFLGDMADRDPAGLDADRDETWARAGTGIPEGTCNCQEPAGAAPGDQCRNCGYTLAAAQLGEAAGPLCGRFETSGDCGHISCLKAENAAYETARRLEAADEAERRSPQAAADWAAANPETGDPVSLPVPYFVIGEKAGVFTVVAACDTGGSAEDASADPHDRFDRIHIAETTEVIG